MNNNEEKDKTNNVKDSSEGGKIEKLSKSRSTNKDRSQNKYSKDDFMGLPRREQFELSKKYWNIPSDQFDDGTFQFSRTLFVKLCEELGFEKSVIDKRGEDNYVEEEIIYIDHGKRDDTELKKLTLSKSTIIKMDKLLGNKLSNVEKSKVIDVLISNMLDEKIEAKENGRFGVAYRPIEEKRIL